MKQVVHELEWNHKTMVNVIMCCHIIIILFSCYVPLCHIVMLHLHPPDPLVMLDAVELE